MKVVNMAHKFDPAELDNAITLYLAGQPLNKCAATLGVSPKVLKRVLTSRGIETRGRVYAWQTIPAEEVISLYVEHGVSEYELSTRFDVDRAAIRTLLTKNQVPIRSHSEAGIVRASKMTAEEIAAQTAAAHAATKGRKATWEERAKRAATVEIKPAPMSNHEATFAGYLDQLGIPWRREVAVGIYNIDFAIGSIAVEILGGEWHAYKGERHPRRIKYILSQGWALVYIWATPNYPLTLASAEHCVTLAQEASRNPAVIGEYRVIRGDAHEIARGRDELDEFSLEQSARNSANLTPSEIGKLGASTRYGRDY